MNSEKKEVGLDCLIRGCEYAIIIGGKRFSHTPREAVEKMMKHLKSHSWIDVEGIVEWLIAERVRQALEEKEATRE